MPRDPYQVLGVEPTADEAQIKKAFRGLARELHPDVNSHDPQAEEKFKEAAEAYEILSDADRRATYDRYGHDGLRSGGYQPNFDSFGSISDLFEAFFGGGTGGGGRGGPAAGADVAASLDLDLAEAARGGTHEVAYEAVDRCDHCKGNGAEPGTPIETCARCAGAGRLQAVTRTPFGQMMRTVACDVCGGDGRVAANPCHECRGRGRRLARRKASIQVPAGIADGQRIRLTGAGHAGEAGAPAGDLYVLIGVRADERFIREDDDLVTLVEISAPHAALGATVEVPTLDGPEEVEVAAGTQPGEVVVLRGRGMPRLRRGGAGDLRVVVNVIVPRRLTREQRKLYDKLAGSMTAENLRTDESVFAKLKRALRSHAA
ncbi:MAG: molecular chaperone DnaJ [Solirubrobacteraceae bacterium]|jgi:molecular chaperone DnaJ|nr:molecular chaperone DnaJ [Solirubrobacteraceae bacterium]